MAEPLPPATLAWLQQSAAVDGAAYSQVLLHLLERVEALEQRPTCKQSLQVPPTPEAVPVAEPVGGAPPAPEPGEVGELVEALTLISDGMSDIGHESDSWFVARAATLLKQQQHLLGLACQELDNFMEQQLSAPAPAVVPVAVAERLPGEGDCDTEGRCWLLTTEDGYAQWRVNA